MLRSAAPAALLGTALLGTTLLGTALLGTVLLGTVLLAPLPAAAQEETRDPVADSLVQRWIEAAGGMEAYHRLRSARFTLTTEIYDPESGRLRRARPRYVTVKRGPAGEAARIERWEGDDYIVQGFDGRDAWARMNGEPLGPGDMDFDEARYVTGDVVYWISLPWKLNDPGVNLHDEGRDEEGRRVVAVTFGEGVGDHQDRWYYLFEDGRSWPVEIHYVEEGQEDVNRTSWRSIRSADGYLYAGERVHVDDEGRVWKILRTTDFELNPEVDDAVFREPEGAVSEEPGGATSREPVGAEEGR